MHDDEPKTLEGIQQKIDEMRAAFREDAQRRLAKLAGGSLPVRPVTTRPVSSNQPSSAKAMAERIVSSAEEKKNSIERWTAQQLKGSSTDDEDKQRADAQKREPAARADIESCLIGRSRALMKRQGTPSIQIRHNRRVGLCTWRKNKKAEGAEGPRYSHSGRSAGGEGPPHDE